MSEIDQTRMNRIATMLEAQPNDSFLLFALAKEYDKINDTDQAIATYDRLMKNDPDYLGLYYHFAEILDRRDQLERAIKIADLGIQVAKSQKNEKDLAELVQLRASF